MFILHKMKKTVLVVSTLESWPGLQIIIIASQFCSLWLIADSLGANSSPDFLYFSAVCWFFGRDLYKQYQVPIGLISSNWGGTAIEDWSAPNVIDACYNRTTANHNT